MPTITLALTRPISASLADCELTYLERQPIDLDRARDQHARYEQALRDVGCRVVALPAAPELPDAVFVEDAAIVLDELAVLTRPGVASRLPELESVETALKRYRRIVRITSPGTLEGGDVLVLGHSIYVGLSGRTNQDGIRQLQAAVAPHGYRVEAVPVRGCLHLKSAVTELAPDLLLVNPGWISPEAFGGRRFVAVAPDEPHAANALRVESGVIFPAAFPETRSAIERQGLAVHAVEVSELQKAEGAVTCCSLIFSVPDAEG
jgi:dimethylargininase